MDNLTKKLQSAAGATANIDNRFDIKVTYVEGELLKLDINRLAMTKSDIAGSSSEAKTQHTANGVAAMCDYIIDFFTSMKQSLIATDAAKKNAKDDNSGEPESFGKVDNTKKSGRRLNESGFFHSVTDLPMSVEEIDLDSNTDDEAGKCSDLLHKKMKSDIDQFSDVNDGEKELFQLWNSHVMRNKYTANKQMNSACESFGQQHKEILNSRLYKNVVLHFCSLYDFGLISQVCIVNCVKLITDK